MFSLQMNTVIILCLTSFLLYRTFSMPIYVYVQPTTEESFQILLDCKSGINEVFGDLENLDRHVSVAILDLDINKDIDKYAREYYESFRPFLNADDMLSINLFCESNKKPGRCKDMLGDIFGTTPFKFRTSDPLHSLIAAFYYVRGEEIRQEFTGFIVTYLNIVLTKGKISLGKLDDCTDGIDAVFSCHGNAYYHAQIAIQYLHIDDEINIYAKEYYKGFRYYLDASKNVKSINEFCQLRKDFDECKDVVLGIFAEATPYRFDASSAKQSVITLFYYLRKFDILQKNHNDLTDYYNMIYNGVKINYFVSEPECRMMKSRFTFCAEMSSMEMSNDNQR